MLQGLWRIFDTAGADEDPLGGLESQGFRINQRVFSNTIEQTAIFVPMFVALAIRMAPEHVFALPILMGIWCVGRMRSGLGTGSSRCDRDGLDQRRRQRDGDLARVDAFLVGGA